MRHLKLAGCVLTGAIAITALAPAAGLAAASAAPPTTVHVKALSLANDQKLLNDFVNVYGDQVTIAGEIFQKHSTRRNHVRVYPTGKALQSDVLRLSKKLKGKVKLGAVPAVHGKRGDFYIGDSTAKRFKVVSFFHVPGHDFRIGLSLGNGIKTLKGSFGKNAWLIVEASYASEENSVAAKLYADANSSSSQPSYPTGASLAKDIKNSDLWADGPVSASVPPAAAKAVTGKLYLGATTTKTFSEAAFFPYKKGWKLKVKATRGLTGPAKLTVTAVKDH
jgi:hypothetical protein